MFFEENEPCEENETNKCYPNDQSYIDNNLIFYEKSENFQDSFLQTFNNQFYNQNYGNGKQANIDDSLYNNYIRNGTTNNNDSMSTLSSSKSSHQHESDEPVESLKYIENDKLSNCPNYQLGGKRGRPMTDKSLIIDEITNKVYDPDIDPEEYRKARKRIQNRESAVRSRMKKKENNKQFEAELDFLRKENYRLNFENNSLKRERVLLYDQIKFLKSIVKKETIDNSPNTQIKNNEQNILIESKASNKSLNNSDDIEKNNHITVNTRPVFGTYKKPTSKLFMIGIFCIISLVYVSMNQGQENGTIVVSNDYTITMKENMNTDVKSKSTFYYFKSFSYLALIIVIALFFVKFYGYLSKKIEFFRTKIIKNS